MSEHIEGRWCKYLRCSKCYAADTWQKSCIQDLEMQLDDAQDRWVDMAGVAADLRERAEIAQRQLAEARAEIKVLRLYGNKDCTGMADAALKESKR